MSELNTPNGYVIASNVEVAAGRSWFSPQMEVPVSRSGVSFEIWLSGSGTGSFIPRGGNRVRHQRASEVVATPASYLGGERLPAIAGLETTDLPDVTTAPLETLLNLGNVNCNFIELQFKCLTGNFRLTCIATCKA